MSVVDCPALIPHCDLEAVVTFEYTAEQEDELNLKFGDVIVNVQTAEGGWWEGELNGRKGLFPENFVKLVKPKEQVTLRAEGKREATQRKSVRELATKLKGNVHVGGPPKMKEKQKKCKVLFEYKKENNDELDLVIGEIVEFHRQVEDGWWEGSVNGRQGVFPSNFVEMIEDTASSDEGSTPSTEEKDKATVDTQNKSADFHTIKGRKVVGVGLGNIFGEGPIKLRAVADSGKKEDTSKPTGQETIEPALDTAMRGKANSSFQSSTEQAVVRFSYTSEQPDELSLVEGQIVRILDKQLEDEGWWKGELNGKVGVFPDNFVELLPNEEVNKLKKPPPPVASAVVKAALPKLPEKTLIGDNSNEQVKTELQPPFAVTKKPLMPPPAIKKPLNQKSVESKIEPSIPPPQANSVKDKPFVKENHTENHKSEGSTHFDDIEPAGQKLTHLTYGRAQGPKKRPPSSVIVLNEGEKDDTLEEIKSNHVSAPDKQQTRLPERPDKPLPSLPSKDNRHERDKDDTPEEIKSNHVPTTEKQPTRLPDRPDKPLPSLPSKDNKLQSQLSTQTENLTHMSQSTSAVISQKDKESHSSVPPPRPPEPVKAPSSSASSVPTNRLSSAATTASLPINRLSSAASLPANRLSSAATTASVAADRLPYSTAASNLSANKLLEQLKIELQELKSNSVSKTVFNELRVQHEKLKIEFNTLKKNHSMKIRDLTNEVDEEKKLRLITQVEIERLKKLLSESHI